MSIKKQYLKSRPVCKVTLRVSKEAAAGAKIIHAVGDFNDWSAASEPMKALKNGDFTCTLELSTGQDTYQFRYLLDEQHWENDWEADAYVANDKGTENSVIQLSA
ncbi:MAG: isoamylase early set domain-containing protein [Thiolinea sp.]